MKKRTYSIFALLLIFSLSLVAQVKNFETQTIPAEYGYLIKPGDKAPDFELTLTDGTVVNSKSWQGKVIMLQFTASWCGVCRREMPHIENEIWQPLKTRDDFVLLGIDRDEPVQKAEQLIESTGISYPIGLDPGAKIFGLFAEKEAGVTRNVIIDKNGNIAFLTRLYKKEEFNQMKLVINALLDK